MSKAVANGFLLPLLMSLVPALSSALSRPQLKLTEANFTSVFPIVCTLNGCIEGIAKTGYQTDEFEAFFGIPYAEPPIGELRFAVSFIHLFAIIIIFVYYSNVFRFR